MATKINSTYLNLILHLVIWIALFNLPHLFLNNRNVPPSFFPRSFFVASNLYNISLFYVNAFVLFPLYFNKRKWWFYIFSIALVLAGSYFLKLFFVKTWYPKLLLDTWAHRVLFFPSFAFIVISTIYMLITKKIKYDKKQKEIVAEQLSVKLKFLRSQINPHFIFNVLTNLVSLARKRSERLEPALLMLSDLMRYMLYESDEKKVLLSNEIEYLGNYIELQKLRFGTDVLVKNNVVADEKELQKSIEPMLLIPFVENAFKHGMGVNEPFIEINLLVDHGRLKFEVKNKFADNDTKDAYPGIGLENVQSRLILLYPGEYRLKMLKERNVFKIHLTLQLK